MRRLYTILFFIVLALTLPSCSTPNIFPEGNISNTSPQENQVTKSSLSILRMTDLEIIKKTADYLKSHGETLNFRETEIIYCCNDSESVICKDEKGKDVIYKGEYLEVKYYPPPDDQNKQGMIIVVFLGEGNRILGYYKDKLSQ